PPSDLPYRGFVLVDHFYQQSTPPISRAFPKAFRRGPTRTHPSIKFEDIKESLYVPTTKNLDKPYSLNYPAPRVLEHINKIILPKYKEVAWSQNLDCK